jgi:hypothetical protein
MPRTGPTWTQPAGPSAGTGGTAGAPAGVAGTAPGTAMTVPGASSPGSSLPGMSSQSASSSGAFSPGASSSRGVSSPGGLGGAGWLPGLPGAGSEMSANGGGFPSVPGLPGKNPAPWAVAGPSSGQEMAGGSGPGSGSGLVAVLTAELLVTVGVQWRRRAAIFRPRSAWLRALEVPG